MGTQLAFFVFELLDELGEEMGVEGFVEWNTAVLLEEEDGLDVSLLVDTTLQLIHQVFRLDGTGENG